MTRFPALSRILALGLLLAAALPAVATERGQTYQEFRQHFAARRYSEALIAANKVVQLTRTQYGAQHPEMVNALMNLGTTQLRMGDYAQAEEAYLLSLKVAEANGGALSRLVLQPLLGLGTTYMAADFPADAMRVLRRAVDLSRKLDGLFSAQQLDLLYPLIDAYEGLGLVDDAEREHRYAIQAAESLHGKTGTGLLPALDRVARWYEATGRYTLAIQVQERALQIVRSAGGDSDLRLIGPLRGLARTYRQEFTFGPEPPDTPGAPPREIELVGQVYSPTLPGAGTSGVQMRPRARGENSLNLALKLASNAKPPERIALRGDTLVDLGDWYLISDRLPRAMQAYRDAWRELSAGDPAGVRSAFGEPHRILFRAAPNSALRRGSNYAGVTEHFVEVEFTVSADGRVQNVRTVQADVAPITERGIVDSLRRARYRPRFVDGEPVATPNQRHRQAVYVRRSQKDPA